MNKRHRLPKIGGGAEGDIRITKITGIFAEDPDATRKDETGGIVHHEFEVYVVPHSDFHALHQVAKDELVRQVLLETEAATTRAQVRRGGSVMPVIYAFRSAITLPMSAVAPLPPKQVMPWKDVAQPIIDAVNESLENTGWSAVGRLRVTSDKRRSRAGHEASSRLGLSRHPSASGHRPPTGVGHVHDAIQIPIGLQPGLLVTEHPVPSNIKLWSHRDRRETVFVSNPSQKGGRMRVAGMQHFKFQDVQKNGFYPTATGKEMQALQFRPQGDREQAMYDAAQQLINEKLGGQACEYFLDKFAKGEWCPHHPQRECMKQPCKMYNELEKHPEREKMLEGMAVLRTKTLERADQIYETRRRERAQGQALQAAHASALLLEFRQEVKEQEEKQAKEAAEEKQKKAAEEREAEAGKQADEVLVQINQMQLSGGVEITEVQRAEERKAKADARLATAIKNWNETETKRKELADCEARRKLYKAAATMLNKEQEQQDIETQFLSETAINTESAQVFVQVLQWEDEEGHPLRALLRKKIDMMDAATAMTDAMAETTAIAKLEADFRGLHDAQLPAISVLKAACDKADTALAEARKQENFFAYELAKIKRESEAKAAQEAAEKKGKEVKTDGKSEEKADGESREKKADGKQTEVQKPQEESTPEAARRAPPNQTEAKSNTNEGAVQLAVPAHMRGLDSKSQNELKDDQGTGDDEPAEEQKAAKKKKKKATQLEKAAQLNSSERKAAMAARRGRDDVMPNPKAPVVGGGGIGSGGTLAQGAATSMAQMHRASNKYRSLESIEDDEK